MRIDKLKYTQAIINFLYRSLIITKTTLQKLNCDKFAY